MSLEHFVCQEPEVCFNESCGRNMDPGFRALVDWEQNVFCSEECYELIEQERSEEFVEDPRDQILREEGERAMRDLEDWKRGSVDN